MDAMPYPGSLLFRPEYDKWNALTKRMHHAGSACAATAFCCGCRIQQISAIRRVLTESIQHHNDYQWGEPVWLLASLITASFARCNWPTEITEWTMGR